MKARPVSPAAKLGSQKLAACSLLLGSSVEPELLLGPMEGDRAGSACEAGGEAEDGDGDEEEES